MECAEITERLWQYLDGELTAKEAVAVRVHLAGCGGCGRHERCDRSFLVLVVRALSRPCAAPPSLRLAIRARLASIAYDR